LNSPDLAAEVSSDFLPGLQAIGTFLPPIDLDRPARISHAASETQVYRAEARKSAKSPVLRGVSLEAGRPSTLNFLTCDPSQSGHKKMRRSNNEETYVTRFG